MFIFAILTESWKNIVSQEKVRENENITIMNLRSRRGDNYLVLCHC